MKDIENIMLFLLNNGDSTSHRLATILNIKVRRVGMILRKATIQGIVSKSTINTPDGKKTVWSANGESLPNSISYSHQAINLVDR